MTTATIMEKDGTTKQVEWKEHTTVFTCHICGETKTHTSRFTTGYGRDKDDNKICFECCGKQDREDMEKTGKAVLYLSFETRPNVGYFWPFNAKLTNWPGTLSIPIRDGAISRGRHNIAGRRYDVWFRFNGQEWHGVQYGDNTQICRCKRLKKQ